MTTLTLLGPGLIAIAWLIQLYRIYAGKVKTFDFRFLVIYAVGSFALAYAGFNSGEVVAGILNLAAGLIALGIGYYVKG